MNSPSTFAPSENFQFMSTYPKYVSQHLTTVYSTLSVLLCITAIGTFFNIKYEILGWSVRLFAICLTIYITMTMGQITSLTRKSFLKRGSLLSLHAFLMGCSLAPLISRVINIDPSIVMTAVLLTASTFVFLTLSALVTERLAFFALASLLSTSIGVLGVYSLLTFFFPSFFSFSLMLYGGVIVFCGLILFNTQVIAERAATHGPGVIKTTMFFDDALLLFSNIISLFIRILIILAENSDKKEARKRDRRN